MEFARDILICAINWLIDLLNDRWIERLIDGIIDWLIDWLFDWLQISLDESGFSFCLRPEWRRDLAISSDRASRYYGYFSSTSTWYFSSVSRIWMQKQTSAVPMASAETQKANPVVPFKESQPLRVTWGASIGKAKRLSSISSVSEKVKTWVMCTVFSLCFKVLCTIDCSIDGSID